MAKLGNQYTQKLRMNSPNRLLAMLFLVILPLLLVSTIVNAEPHFTFCADNAPNYTQNSSFQNNLKILLDSLSSNTSANRGFYETSIVNDSNAVYGQALCRGDITPTVCQNCVANVSQEIIKQCNSQEAILWYELCQIHYSYVNFSSSPVYTGKYPQSNLEEKSVPDPIRFQVALNDLMDIVSKEAANDPSRFMFSTRKIKVSKTETIYGLAQCTRDVSVDECITCFNSALTELKACCKSKKGGTVFSRSCNVRFEMYPFYNHSTSREARDKWKIWVIVAVTVSIFVLAVLAGCFIFYLRQKRQRQTGESNLVTSKELPFMDLTAIKEATDNFSDSNKIGQGGFGSVYKGVLSNGNEIAVKRLSRKSWQGLEEFKNEIVLISKLQHRNLVKLLGSSIEGDEKLLIYEYVPNKSLDAFIFDSEKRTRLNWETRLNIINGIARGLLYLHEESRLKIIHRDLKPSNILLDYDMVAKISDFGMARIFVEDQNSTNTKRVVGTYGYMAPEYAMEGIQSVKSDVFSFGVILLEIVSGKRNSGFYLTEHAQTLLAYAWCLWSEGKELEFVDPLLTESWCTSSLVRCIHIGLLCVQEDPSERPTASSVVILLGSESVQLPQPTQPATISVRRRNHLHHIDHQPSTTTDPLRVVVHQMDQSSTNTTTSPPSINQVTVSSISPR